MPEVGKKVPLVKGLPLVGSMFPMLADHIDTFLKAREEYGDIVHIKAGPPGLRLEYYGVFSHTGVQQVLNDAKTFRKDSKGYREFRELAGNGIMASQDERYEHQRRVVHPLFTNRTVDTYTDVICEEVVRTTSKWGEVEVVDVHRAASEMSIHTIARTTFGNTKVDDVVEIYQKTIGPLSSYVVERAFQPRSIPRTWPTPKNRRVDAAKNLILDICTEIITRRMSMPDVRSNDLVTGMVKARDEHGNPLEVSEIRDVAVSFLTSSDDTANSIGFAMHLLGNHPEIQEKCRAEVMAQIGDRRPLPSDVIRLPYVASVVKETMRLFPPVPGNERNPIKDVVIDGYHIPAGASILISPWITHRHPGYWPDPERFDPDRFLPGNETNQPRYAWFPFGGGSRKCLAQYFAMLHSVLSVAMMLRDFEFETIDQNIPISYGIVFVPQGPVRCRVRRLR